jgi:signal transduction histidine kinase
MTERAVRVLLVEDDEDDYLLTKDLFAALPTASYTLDRAATYEAALDAFQSCVHDLYLIDYRLGKHTGLDILAEARRRGCAAPMIMLTAQTEREIDLRAMHAGAVDFLVKDRLDSQTLERSMRYALEHARQAESIRQANQQLEDRVGRRTAELARVNETLQQEIAERKRAEAALREADRRKDEFLATLGHELRNPLSALANALSLVELEPDNPAELVRLRDLIRRQVEQLIRLIDDLLDVSRISQGKLELRREVVTMGAVIESALDLARPSIDAEGHTLEVSLPSEPLALNGDKIRLAQIVSNLLVNAARYTPPGGRIEVSAKSENGEAIICVRDNGIGIPTDMLPKVFELFTQVDRDATSGQQGLGIGLTLVKTLVEMHGGRVEAKSAGPGHGSAFIVRLPLAAAESAAPHDVSAVSSPPSSDARDLPAFRILVVDDNESASYLLGRLLQKLGHHVHTAATGEAALENIAYVKPDVVFSDIAMPGMSGYDLARHIRRRRDLPQPVLVALTGYGQQSDRQQALAAGFDEHLTKPASLPGLIELLHSLPMPRR